MELWICVTWSTQFAPSQEPPLACPICRDQRQYVGYEGRRWTPLAKLRASGLRPVFKGHESHLIGIGSDATCAIGQRALLVQTTEGNLLWDCLSCLDGETVERVAALGALRAIASSHPHYYSGMVEWAERFSVPVYLHAADRRRVMSPSKRLAFWPGETRELCGGMTLLCLGGHFPGGAVLYWPDGAEGRGAVLSSDIIQVVADRRWVSFMDSYPNLIPLPASEVARIRSAIAPIASIASMEPGAWFERVIFSAAYAAVMRSAEGYIQAPASQLPA
ncbi:hypothetical protein [Thermogemmatispora sp.]|uniref:hypothetical protein n=1 Tax=Thermogemmatispora sp. TaxID=1968838 RepID=UPI001D3BE954|nr:hypothetical protein [Thermogemmatispora sp.]MBX5450551.1 MBL fold metallo-hydrolase [Thermogemmatispora sp.]